MCDDRRCWVGLPPAGWDCSPHLLHLPLLSPAIKQRWSSSAASCSPRPPRRPHGRRPSTPSRMLSPASGPRPAWPCLAPLPRVRARCCFWVLWAGCRGHLLLAAGVQCCQAPNEEAHALHVLPFTRPLPADQRRGRCDHGQRLRRHSARVEGAGHLAGAPQHGKKHAGESRVACLHGSWVSRRVGALSAARRGPGCKHGPASAAACLARVPPPLLRLQVIAKARVPIVKFEDASSGYAFDLSFDVANGPEVRAAEDEGAPHRPRSSHLATAPRYLPQTCSTRAQRQQH